MNVNSFTTAFEPFLPANLRPTPRLRAALCASSVLDAALMSPVRRPQLEVRRSYLHHAAACEPWRYRCCVSISLPSHITSLCFPKGQDMWRKNTALPHRLGPINAGWEKQSLSSRLRCLGKDLLKVVLRRSTSLSGYHSDEALSKGPRGIAPEASLNNAEEFAKCLFFFGEECAIKLPSLFVFPFLSVKLCKGWDGNSRALTHGGSGVRFRPWTVLCQGLKPLITFHMVIFMAFLPHGEFIQSLI